MKTRREKIAGQLKCVFLVLQAGKGIRVGYETTCVEAGKGQSEFGLGMLIQSDLEGPRSNESIDKYSGT